MNSPLRTALLSVASSKTVAALCERRTNRPKWPNLGGRRPPLQPLRELFIGLLAIASTTTARAAQTNLNDHNFTLPDGFTVELVARAPLVNRPISIAFDERGRLYATDSSGSSDKGPTQYERKDHRIVRLEDTDGDGRFDKSVVFADKMMFPEGAMFYDGSLYVAAPPQIWKLTDTDSDGIADQREVWHDGKTLTGCANDLHGPYLGPDGWIYWAKGAFAEQRYTLPNGKPFVTRASHIFRARPDGTGIEPVLTGGMDNPVGVAFHSTGERFLSCTFVQPGGGKRDGLLHAVYGGVYGKEQAALDGHPRTGDLMPVLHHSGASAPCGLTTYRSRVFGADWSDNLLACYFNLRKVVRHELLPDGATFKTKDTDLLASDHVDFHPTDVLEDADGSILIVDTGGWYKICCPTSQLAKPDVLGGIYRLRKVGMPKPADPRGLKLSWPALKPAELAKLLSDERLYVRQRAIQELGKRGEAAVHVLREAVMKEGSGDTRRNTVWALSHISGAAAREAVRTALNDTDASVRHAALHVVSVWRDTHAVGRIHSFVNYDQTNAALKRVAAEAAGRLGGTNNVEALLASASLPFIQQGKTSAERVLSHSLTYAMIEINQPAAVRAAFDRLAGWCATSRNDLMADAIIAKLTALDQMPTGDLKPEEVLSTLDTYRPHLQQAALRILGLHPTWGPHIVGHLKDHLKKNASSPGTAPELQASLSQLASSPVIQDLLAQSIGDTSLPMSARRLALQAMVGANLKEPPVKWFDRLADMIGERGSLPVRDIVGASRVLNWPKSGHSQLAQRLLMLAKLERRPVDERVSALGAMPGPVNIEELELFDLLLKAIEPSQSAYTRSAATSLLAKAKLSNGQRLELAEAMRGVSPLDAPRLLPAFEKSPNEALGLKLVAALKDSTGLRGLRVDLLKPLFAKYPKTVQDAGAELLALLNADAGKQRAHLETLLPTLKDGDVARGHAVFNSQKSACFSCHAIGYRGGKLGPDLTRIGQVRTEMDLLESIIYPSASFVRSYEPFTVVVKGGEDVTGIVRKDAPDEVVLANGPETEARIARAEVVEMRPGKVSLMPDGMEQALTRQELADLLAFLRAAK